MLDNYKESIEEQINNSAQPQLIEEEFKEQIIKPSPQEEYKEQISTVVESEVN